MNSALFYREQKAIFVVGALTVWFALLALFGPYLPANARASVRQVAMNSAQHEITGEWVRKGERWTFRKIVSLKRVRTRVASKRAVAALRAAKLLSSTARVASSQVAPATTASIASVRSARTMSKKVAARAVRQKLAAEIGRWAKIGDRWEWSEGSVSAKVFTSPKDELLSEYSRWQRRGGFWVFDVDARTELFLNI